MRWARNSIRISITPSRGWRPPEYADGTVIGELQPGYLFHERVLRPAMVRVASAPEPKSACVEARQLTRSNSIRENNG